MSDTVIHDIIYLEPEISDETTGQMWAPNDVWGGGIEYVRCEELENIKHDLEGYIELSSELLTQYSWQPIEDTNSREYVIICAEHRDSGRRRVVVDFMRHELFWDNQWKPIFYMPLPPPPTGDSK